MRPFAHRPPIRDEQRRANDGHRHGVAVAVLAALAALAWLWTGWIGNVPGISALADLPVLGEGVTSEGRFATGVWVHYLDVGVDIDTEIRVLLLLSALGFLSAYYLPLEYKRFPLVVLTFVGLGSLVGVADSAMLLSWHLAAYATFHAPRPGRARTAAGVAAFALCVWIAILGPSDPLAIAWRSAVTFAAVYPAWVFALLPLLRSRAAPWIRGAMAHVALIYITVVLLGDRAVGGGILPRPVGWLLFFWQWERMVMYRIDLDDGRIPGDVGLGVYLATFFSPAYLANLAILTRIPLGYAYLNNSFLARDKNRIVLSGLRLIGASFVFFYLHPVVLGGLTALMAALDLPVWISYADLIEPLRQEPVVGGLTLAPPSLLSVWLVLVYPFLSFYLLWSGIAHFRVGLWRLCGYDIEPYFQKPFLSTNFVELWRRYSYYYREFLVQAFYVPVFLRWFRSRPRLRILAATLAAAGVGNMIFHLMDESLTKGIAPATVEAQLATWPYFVLLGLAIGLTQVWQLARGRSRRRPWTPGWKISLDVVAVGATFGAFVLIRVFHYVPRQFSLGDALRIVGAAFGL